MSRAKIEKSFENTCFRGNVFLPNETNPASRIQKDPGHGNGNPDVALYKGMYILLAIIGPADSKLARSANT